MPQKPMPWFSIPSLSLTINRGIKVNKQDLINYVANESKLTKVNAAKSVDSVLKAIKSALRKGDEVRLIGFGTFKTRHVNAREVRNPRDGTPVKVPARKRVKFNAGLDLKKAANS
jgi:DNA-binding protein HU-beta